MICFNEKKFKDWLETLGCDCCTTFYILEDNKVIDKWESNINGVITKYKDIILEGVIIEDVG